jgi:hypothetical protein
MRSPAPRASLHGGSFAPAAAMLDASAGWGNSFVVVCVWAILSAWWRGVELRQWAAVHCPSHLLFEGALIELGLSFTFLLCASVCVGGLCGASSGASYLMQGVGTAALLYGPIYWVRFSGGRAWPFLTRLALVMQAAVMVLKFTSLVATRRALEVGIIKVDEEAQGDVSFDANHPLRAKTTPQNNKP